MMCWVLRLGFATSQLFNQSQLSPSLKHLARAESGRLSQFAFSFSTRYLLTAYLLLCTAQDASMMTPAFYIAGMDVTFAPCALTRSLNVAALKPTSG